MTVHIEDLGGNCPVQAHGNVDGRAFYFRARGEWWSLELENGDESDAAIQGRYGPRFSAGWMSEAEARQIITTAAPMLVALLDLPNRRGEKPKPLMFGDEGVHERWKAMAADARARAEILADNEALRARVKELEAKLP